MPRLRRPPPRRGAPPAESIGAAGKVYSYCGCRYAADHHLSFGPDIEKPRAEGDRNAETGEYQRNGIENRELDVATAHDRSAQQRDEGCPWIAARGCDDGSSN